MNNFSFYFLVFIIYSFCGWIVEIIDQYFEKGKIINRGFLIGPYCPIYGVGGLFMIFTLTRFMDNPFTLIIMAMLICSVLEYLTGFLMEKLFHARWWDYSDKKLNLNGRICLENIIGFGILGALFLYGINPFIFSKLKIIPTNILAIISLSVLIIFIIDLIISLNIICRFKVTMKTVEKDGTAEITKRVKEILLSKNWLFRRLINAFPNIINPKELFMKIPKTIKEIPNKISATIDKVKK